MCISCDGNEEEDGEEEEEGDAIIVEEDQLPLMRKYTEQEMEEYYKLHYEEFGQIEILMICSDSGKKLKEMFCNIIKKVNVSIKNMHNVPEKQNRPSDLNTRGILITHYAKILIRCDNR